MSPKSELVGIGVLTGAIWATFAVDAILPIDLCRLGLVPRSRRGLVGIPLMPFLHENLRHIVGNTMPLAVFLALLVGSRARSWSVVTLIVLGSGSLLWMIGRQAIHIGASGLVFGLGSFLISAGFLERRPLTVLIAVLVGVTYGGSLLGGLLPTDARVSWDGHLAGAVAGATVAFMTIPKSGQSDRQ